MAAVERTISSSFEEFSSKSSVAENDLEENVSAPRSPRSELQRLQELIELIKNNLEGLNAKFGKFKEPPPIYLNEYEELTTKIHKLQEKELQLQEQLSFDASIREDEKCTSLSNDNIAYNSQPSLHHYTNSYNNNAHYNNTFNSTNSNNWSHNNTTNWNNNNCYNSYNYNNNNYNSSHSLANNTYNCNINNSSNSNTMSSSGHNESLTTQKSNQPIPPGFIKAYLPHGQVTTLKVKGSLESLLKKGLSRRGIDCSGCQVLNKTNRGVISWTDDSSLYSGQEILVELCLCTNNGSHKFVRKTLLSLSCHGCHKVIFQGLKCEICQKRYHVKCTPEYKRETSKFYDHQDHLDHHQDHYRSKSFPNVHQLGTQQTPRCTDFNHYDNPACMKGVETSSKVHSAHTSPTNNTKKSRRDSNKDWEIPESEIAIESKIGSGSYGIVYKGAWHGTVAIKKLNVQQPTTAQLLAFKNEVTVLRKMRHLNILYFMGCVSSSSQLAIVTQWCEGSSLFKHLHVYDERFDTTTLMVIMKQIAQGMDYLHARNVIHRDLKSNNIFLTDDFCVKIGDFGLATVKVKWDGEHQTQKLSGSVMWMSPEIIRMKLKDPYTFKSDVYAYGIVLFELVSNQMPYKIDSRDQIMYLVATRKLQPDLKQARKDLPKGFLDLIRQCIHYEYQERLLFPEILSRLETFISRLPKISSSISMPTLTCLSKDYDLNPFDCTSPRTPINPKNVYTFPSTNTWRKI